MSTPSWEIELVKINNAQNPAIALNELALVSPDVAMQIPPAGVVEILQRVDNPTSALNELALVSPDVVVQLVLETLQGAQNPAIALNELVLVSPDVVMQIPPADVLEILQGAQNPASALNELALVSPEVVMQIPPADVLEILQGAQNPAIALNELALVSPEVVMQTYEETHQAQFWQTLSDTDIVQKMEQQLLTKANESNATAKALQETHEQLELNVPAVVTGITLAYLQHAGVSQKAEKTADDETLQEIQKTAFKISNPRL